MSLKRFYKYVLRATKTTYGAWYFLIPAPKQKHMERIKAAIIYYSSTGANHQMATWAKESAEQAGAEVRIKKVKELAPREAIEANPAWQKHVENTHAEEEATLEDLEWADVFIFSAPTRYGNLPAQMKQFLDSTGPLWTKGKLANKVATAMSSAMNVHGGQEATILNFYTTMYHWGVIVVAPGYTDPVLFKTGGNPYGTSTAVDDDGNMKDDVRAGVIHQTKRAITVARWIKAGARSDESADRERVNELKEA